MAYTEANIATLPKLAMHSVGIIEVTIVRGAMDRAIELATDKGRELGCWIVVEHAAYVRLGASAWLDGGVAIILAHGGAPEATHVRPPKDVVQFDCVIQGAPTSARLRVTPPRRSRSLLKTEQREVGTAEQRI